MENNSINQQETLGNSTTILVLGILSIFPGVACVGIVGVVLGIITLAMSKKTKIEIENNPGKYTDSSITLQKAGRICGIIGLSLSSIYLIFWIVYFVIIGAILGSAGAGSMYY
ncbi:MAG: CCC motif membrane protein [Flavobacteriales bacterium]|nr:CCC motif membrane protein [Flavobacteriales bacterium]